jgi:phosphoribosylanthranilate isomerase
MMIKICGITRRQDAEAAVEAGASALGFVFYPPSPRYVTPVQAAGLGEGLDAWRVGVFVDPMLAELELAIRYARLDVVQVYGAVRAGEVSGGDVRDGEVNGSDVRHGKVRDSEVRGGDVLDRESGVVAPAGVRVWKAIRVAQEAAAPLPSDFSAIEAILLDGCRSGVPFDWRIARSAAGKIVVAGGLDASNVAQAIRTAQPWGVDASSGLESAPGVKDREKIRRFVEAARHAYTENTAAPQAVEVAKETS